MKQKYQYLIEKHLWGELTAEEQAELEQLRREDTAFAAALAEEEQMRDFLQRREQTEEVKHINRELGNEFFPPASPRSGRRRLLFILSAAATVLVGGLLVWLWGFPASPQALYQAYATHDPVSITERSSGQTGLNAQRAFNEGRYSDALGQLKELAARYPGDPELNRALGIAYLETGQLDRALTIFQTLANGTSAARNEGIWYAALTYLRMEDKDSAREWLQRIERGTRRYPAARKLSRRL